MDPGETPSVNERYCQPVYSSSTRTDDQGQLSRFGGSFRAYRFSQIIIYHDRDGNKVNRTNRRDRMNLKAISHYRITPIVFWQRAWHSKEER